MKHTEEYYRKRDLSERVGQGIGKMGAKRGTAIIVNLAIHETDKTMRDGLLWGFSFQLSQDLFPEPENSHGWEFIHVQHDRMRFFDIGSRLLKRRVTEGRILRKLNIRG